MSEEEQMTETESAMEMETGTEIAGETESNEIGYHAVEKDGHVTAIWEMKGRRHLRTIDPRSHEGKSILGTHEIDEKAAPAITESEN